MIRQLVNVGLTENEAKVYLCLLRKQLFTATEISRCAQVNRSKIYTVLDSLIKKGLCSEKLGKVKKYQAENPQIAFQNLVEIQTQKLHQLTELQDKLQPIYQQQTSDTSPLEFIQVFGTPASIVKKHHTLELQSKQFVHSFCKPPFAMSNELHLHKEQITAMKRGVKYISIYEVERDDIQFFALRMKNFAELGEEVRVAYHLPIKLHIFDTNTVMFSMINKLNPNENLTYLVIEHSDLANTLISTFNLYWQQALTVKEFLAKEGITL